MTTELDHILNHRSLRKSRRRWRWIAIAALLALVIGLLAPFFPDAQVRSSHIARLEVSGLITGPQEQLDLLKDIAKDDHAKALLLRIDSPGGTTAGSEALYEAIRKVAEKKPVVAVMDTVAASGGYITALAADRIYARGNTITGSIGVIFSYPEVSGLLTTLGVKMEELKSGELKAEPSPYKPASEKAKAVAMEMVMDGFVWFKGLVTERRKLTPARTDFLADGRVYTGRQAVKEGLIDALGAEEDAVSWLEKERKLAADLPVITRSPPKDLAGNYLGANIANRLLGSFGLGALAGSMSPPKLDGLLVLWHPQT